MDTIGLPSNIFYIKNPYYNPLLPIEIYFSYFNKRLDTASQILYTHGVNRNRVHWKSNSKGEKARAERR